MSYDSIKVETNFRFVERKGNSSAPHLIYVLHGYSQLALYFIRKFQELGEEFHIIAAEGMHRFYLQGNSGRVGASWMTKEGRELDIMNNIRALDQLHREVLSRMTPRTITVLGFSQGGPTASRWVEYGDVVVDTFISWASVYPPDLEELNRENKPKRSVFVLGNQDQFFDSDAQEAVKKDYANKGFEVVSFSGTHDIDVNSLKNILNEEV